MSTDCRLMLDTPSYLGVYQCRGCILRLINSPLTSHITLSATQQLYCHYTATITYSVAAHSTQHSNNHTYLNTGH